MVMDSGQRAYRLVEELRAEIDFEIDDVISEIVRSLPEDYFRTLSHEDQLIHLKALLAISVCNLRDRITLRSENGRHVAVVARQNYPGMLAKIIADLPQDQPLIGAKIFTSKAHDFIIDLFDFQPDQSSASEHLRRQMELERDDLALEVSQRLGISEEEIRQFVELYPNGIPALESSDEIAQHFQAFELARQSPEIVVAWAVNRNAKITIASEGVISRRLFQDAAQALANLHADISQAFLFDFPLSNSEFSGKHIAIASFIAEGEFPEPTNCYVKYLQEFLTEQP